MTAARNKTSALTDRDARDMCVCVCAALCRGKKQFQFLDSSSPYHAYYKQRVRFGADGPPKSSEAEQAALLAKEQEARAQQAALDAAKAAAMAEPKKLTLTERLQAIIIATQKPDQNRVEEEERKLKEKEAAARVDGAAGDGVKSAAGASFTYKLKHPDQYSPVDIDIIKLTALYLARCGLEFLHGLQRRESRNPYFDFLKPQHPLFVFFQHLVDSYKRIILRKNDTRAEIKAQLARSRTDVYKELMVQSVLNKKKLLAEAKAKEAEDGLTSSFIDWKDFVVLQSISFNDDEDDLLPVPRETLEEMAAMLNAQVEEPTTSGDQDMDMDMDVDEPTNTAAAAPTAATTKDDSDEVARLIRSSIASGSVAASASASGDDELEVRLSDDSDDLPKSRPGVFQKCQVCGDEIAIDDLAEHMRIELLDPRWKEQKQLLLDRQRESSLTADATVGQNLARLAKRTAALQGADKDEGARNELKARKQALADAILLYGPQSLQAREAAARAGEIAPPPPPPSAAPTKPTPTPATNTTPIGPPKPTPSPPPPPPATSTHIAPPPPAHTRPTPTPTPATSAPGMTPGGAPGLPARPPYAQPSGPPGAFAPPPGVPGFGAYMPPYGAPGVPIGYGMPPPPPGMMMPPPGAFPAYPSMPPPPPGAFPPPAQQQPQPQPTAFIAATPAAPIATSTQLAHAPPQPEDEPAAKKQRTDAGPAAAAPTPAAGKVKMSESDWLASNPLDVTLRIQVPNDPAQPFHFTGQEITLQLKLSDSIQTLKERLAPSLNSMPANKMKLQFGPNSGGAHINKDELTLAAYNTPQDATIIIGIKERGGKKK